MCTVTVSFAPSAVRHVCASHSLPQSDKSTHRVSCLGGTCRTNEALNHPFDVLLERCVAVGGLTDWDHNPKALFDMCVYVYKEFDSGSAFNVHIQKWTNKKIQKTEEKTVCIHP